jgi:hypothetical protein
MNAPVKTAPRGRADAPAGSLHRDARSSQGAGPNPVAPSHASCSRCALPSTFPQADLADGTCRFCREGHAPEPPRGHDALNELLSSEKGEEYDCLVPLSGGKDSTYALYYTAVVLGLRTLAVNYDSGLQSPISMDNMRRSCEKLGVPLVFKRVKRDRQFSMLRDILRVSDRVGCFFHVCGNCETAIRATAMRTAEAYGIPFIVMGDDRLPLLGTTFPFMGSRAFFERLLHRPSVLPEVVLRLTRYMANSMLQRRELGVRGRERLRPFHTIPYVEDGYRIVHLFDYLPWDPPLAVDTIRRELDWRSAEGQTARFDCLLHCYGNSHWLQEAGLTLDGFVDCAVARTGRITTDEAVRNERHRVEHLDEECLRSTHEIQMGDPPG